MYKLLSHNDLDGVSCGILAKLAFGKDVKVRYNSVSGLDREVRWFLEHDNKETFLFITDLSVNEENEKALEAFHEDGGELILLDHHKTALHFNEYEWGFVEVENERGQLNAATSLLYEYLIGKGLLERTDALDEYVELVRLYDTWEWEAADNQHARRLNALFYLISIEDFENKMITRLTASEHFHFDELEKEILNLEDEKILRYIKRKRRELVQIGVADRIAGVVHAESYHSELGNQLGKDCPHLDYIAIINMGGRRAGFRTIHNHVDVSEVAARYGGGGHAKAAGSPLTEEAYNELVAGAFTREPLREDASRNRYNLKEAEHGSLYKNQIEERFLIHAVNDEWAIEKNGIPLELVFADFAAAEKFLKRTEEAWLARDDDFVDYFVKLVEKNRG